VNRETRFSTPGLHQLVYVDDFYPAARAVRAELLAHPAWVEMWQDDEYGASMRSFNTQNGITTGHLVEADRAALPHTLAFCDFLRARASDLAVATGADIPADAVLEVNAMAYGEGGWLSPHTDHAPVGGTARVLAWMLYLTHPDDGEWPLEWGGAVRLSAADGREQRLAPKFNRFAAFAVSDASTHEILRVMRPSAWDRSRLALSGWLRRPAVPPARSARLYVQRADADAVRAEREAVLRGAIAMYGLMREQRLYAGQPPGKLDDILSRYRAESDAHAAAPRGTVFAQHVAGPPGSIIVVDERRQLVYVGAPEDYAPNV
jgi:hypothetical protein